MSTTVLSWGHSGLSVDTTFVRVVLTEHMDFAASTFHGHSCHDSIAETVFISSVSTVLKLPSIFFFFFLNLHNTKHENNTAATNIWSSDYISQKTDNQVLGNKNSEHTNQREALISEGIIKTETILQHICGHSIATSGYLRYEFTGLSRFLKIRLSRKPKLF